METIETLKVIKHIRARKKIVMIFNWKMIFNLKTLYKFFLNEIDDEVLF